jgi:hypothetical protein
MALHVNANLALKSAPEEARRAGTVSAATRRARLAAQFIPAGARVFDLGEGGGEALRDLLPFGCSYQAGDDLAHGRGSLIHGLTGREFPTKAASESDVVVMLGIVESIADLESLFTHLRFCRPDVILSYCPVDLVGSEARVARGFVNHLSYVDLVTLFDRYGFRIECTAPAGDDEMLMRLTPTNRVAPVSGCDIAVISEGDAGGFGDRLGRLMINGVLPGTARVQHMTFDALDEARGDYDLVVVGVGTAMFRPLIGDDIIRILARAKSAVGIFGTAYRELIPRAALERVIDRLDGWFAPYEDDIRLYGRGRSNAEHLGDWLIAQCPLAESILDEPLQIGAEVAADLPLERTIRLIQRHRRVYSEQAQALLCALTAAEYAAFAEAGSSPMPGVVSGTFRSMLIDIFGRGYPEREFFMVDRDAVARYKARVHGNVAAMRERIAAILSGVAVAAV